MKKKQKKKKVVEQGGELMNRKKMSTLSSKVTSTSQETETSETDRQTEEKIIESEKKKVGFANPDIDADAIACDETIRYHKIEVHGRVKLSDDLVIFRPGFIPTQDDLFDCLSQEMSQLRLAEIKIAAQNTDLESLTFNFKTKKQSFECPPNETYVKKAEKKFDLYKQDFDNQSELQVKCLEFQTVQIGSFYYPAALKVFDFSRGEILSINANSSIEPTRTRTIDLTPTEHLVSAAFATSSQYPVSIEFVVFNGAKIDVLAEQMRQGDEIMEREKERVEEQKQVVEREAVIAHEEFVQKEAENAARQQRLKVLDEITTADMGAIAVHSYEVAR